MRTKAFRKTQKAISLLMVLLMTSLLVLIPVTNVSAAAQETPSTNPNDYYTQILGGTIVDYFTYSGGVLFCGDNGDPAPASGTYPENVSLDTSYAHNEEMLLKTLYYGYSGPGNATYPPGSIPNTSATQKLYLITEMNVHRAIHGDYREGFAPSYQKDAGIEWERVAALPTPNWELDFSPESTSNGSIVTLDDGIKVQRSAAIALTGGPSENTVKVPVAAPYTIRKSDGTVYSAGTTAVIKVGESFYVEAPLGHIGTFNPTGLKGEMEVRMVVFVLNYAGSKTQTLYGGACYGTNVDLKVAFNGLVEIVPDEYSVVVHKYGIDSSYTTTLDPVGTLIEGGVVGYTVDEEGNTIEVTLNDLPLLANVPFLLEKLLLNTSTDPGADTYIVDTSFEPILKKTDSMGIINFEGLAAGIYRVTEQPNNISLYTAAPAIFALPFAGPDGSILDVVHIYPKNVVKSPEIEKTVGDGSHATVNIPDEIPWTIKTEIPRDIDECETYTIRDTFPSVLRFVNGSLKLSFLDASDNEVFLTEGTDYTYTADVAGDIQTLSVTLTAAGKIKLATSFTTSDRSDQRWLKTTFTTRINVAPEDLEEYLATPIENQAELIFKDSAGVDYNPKSEKPEVHLGGVLLKKVNKDSKVLSGAQFKVYPTLADAQAGTNAIQDPANTSQDWVITSDADGLVKIFGLAYGTDGQTHNDPTASTDYWIVEVASPKDELTGNYYSLLIEPFKVTVNATSHLAENAITVINVMPELPATGGSGTMWYTALGVLIFILGIGVVTLRRKFA